MSSHIQPGDLVEVNTRFAVNAVVVAQRDWAWIFDDPDGPRPATKKLYPGVVALVIAILPDEDLNPNVVVCFENVVCGWCYINDLMLAS